MSFGLFFGRERNKDYWFLLIKTHFKKQAAINYIFMFIVPGYMRTEISAAKGFFP